MVEAGKKQDKSAASLLKQPGVNKGLQTNCNTVMSQFDFKWTQCDV